MVLLNAWKQGNHTSQLKRVYIIKNTMRLPKNGGRIMFLIANLKKVGIFRFKLSVDFWGQFEKSAHKLKLHEKSLYPLFPMRGKGKRVFSN